LEIFIYFFLFERWWTAIGAAETLLDPHTHFRPSSFWFIFFFLVLLFKIY
jgi:hypothetical protein